MGSRRKNIWVRLKTTRTLSNFNAQQELMSSCPSINDDDSLLFDYDALQEKVLENSPGTKMALNKTDTTKTSSIVNHSRGTEQTSHSLDPHPGICTSSCTMYDLWRMCQRCRLHAQECAERLAVKKKTRATKCSRRLAAS